MLKSNKSGISLIEAIITVAILSIGILTIASIFPFILKTARAGEQETIAANLAQAKIEELFYTGYDNLEIGVIEPKARLSEDTSNPFYQYQREVEINYVDGNLDVSVSDTGLKEITVTIYYNSTRTNSEKSLPFSVLIVKK